MRRSITGLLTGLALVIAAGSATAGPTAGHDKKFFVQSEDGRFRFQPGLRIQSRLVVDRFSADESSDLAARFVMQRLQLNLTGHAYGKDLRYRLMVDWGKGATQVKHAYVDLPLFDGAVRLRVGHDKRPYSRQQIASVGALQLIDRALTDKGFRAGHDLGLYFHNGFGRSSPFEWALGVFNGTSHKRLHQGSVTVDPVTGEGVISSAKPINFPQRFRPALVARVGYNYGEVKGYKETDFTKGPLRVSAALGALHELDADDDGERFTTANLDFIAKAYGLSLSGGLYWSRSHGEAEGDPLMRRGLHVQTGYLFGEWGEPLLRVSVLDDDDRSRREETVGFAVYFSGHSVKWGNNLSRFVAGGADETPDEYRGTSQLQFQF